jgi:hypothetical protein
MNGKTITKALATAGFTAAAGMATMLGTTCTLVHFGQPDVDRGETESIVRAAITKIRRQH